MGRSDTVYFPIAGSMPTQKEVLTLCEDYVTDIGTVEQKPSGVIFIDLPGKPAWPMRRIWPDASRAHPDVLNRQRWIEVYVFPKADPPDLPHPWISVVTRAQDDIVHGIAVVLARTLAIYWHGKVQDP